MALKYPQVTRGGLAPATIKNLVTSETVKFMFNPYEFAFTKSNSWNEEPVTGQNVPKVSFQHGGPITLKLTLHFDSQDSGTDVRQYTNALWTMMLVTEQEKNQRSGKSQPPPVAFEWGKLYFKAIITNMTQTFTLFSEKGVPLRCKIDIDLKQFHDENDVQPQIPGQPPGQGAAQATPKIEGQSLDQMAAQQTGSSSNYRKVAEDNNINDPLNVPNGKQLKFG